jgi:hypothetical protein
MTELASLLNRLRPHLDRSFANDLLTRAVQAASVTGDEARMVDMQQPEMQRLGLAPLVEDFLPGRPNITGRRLGGGAGPELLSLVILMSCMPATGQIIGQANRKQTRPGRRLSTVNCGGAVRLT